MKKPKYYHLVTEITVLFLIAILLTGAFTYFTQYMYSTSAVTEQLEESAEIVSREVMEALREYPAYGWLVRYWYDHWDIMDIEYDIDFTAGSTTEAKCRAFQQRYPSVQMKYATPWQIASLPEEDQKIYAEVIYAWVTARLDQIKQAQQVDYLFGVVTDMTGDNAYKTQFFLFSAADKGAKRGTAYEQVYPIGVSTSVADNAEQQKTMRDAVLRDREVRSESETNKKENKANHLATAGNYMDHYAYMMTIQNKALLIGLTYNRGDIMSSIRQQSLRGTALAMLYVALLSFLGIALVYRFAIDPLKQVQKSIRLYRTTKNSKTVIRSLYGVKAKNEIGQLSEDVADLAKVMDQHVERIESITAERERIGTELALATRIQADMLPNTFPAFPDRHDFDIYASMIPAREVGGDFYDYFLIDDDHLALVIADVSGKGVPAALFMMATMIVLHYHLKDSPNVSPAKVLQSVNEELCSNNQEEMFVTVWLGVLELSTGKLTASNAGHEYPILKQPGGHFEVLKDRHGFVLGGLPGAKYRDYELQLEPGGKLFVYTDGLPEATDSQEQLYGMDNVLESLRRWENREAADILSHMNQDVRAYVGEAPQFDDLTMLCVTYQPMAEHTAPQENTAAQASAETEKTEEE